MTGDAAAVAELQNCRTAELQNCKTAKLRNSHLIQPGLLNVEFSAPVYPIYLEFNIEGKTFAIQVAVMILNSPAKGAQFINLGFAEHGRVFHSRSVTVVNVFNDIIKGIKDDLVRSITSFRIGDG